MDREIDFFIRDYLKVVREDNAAIFAGAEGQFGSAMYSDLLHTTN